mmetsp:Transcript_34320/g.99684  ORF Transcript_34320/g.99684 Transcript_34320/m.99684 type:complete len:337 (-) Transcript_34320:373-1383(-)
MALHDMPPPPLPPAHEIVLPSKVLADVGQVDGGPSSDIRDKYLQLQAEGRSVELNSVASTPEATRGLELMDRLRGAPNVESYLARAAAEDKVSVLEEVPAGGTTLGARFAELQREQQGNKLVYPVMPFEESLPLLVDILRGVDRLNSAGIVHLDLTGDKGIALVPDPREPDRMRAVISELGTSACIVDGEDGALSCDQFLDGRGVGSPYRLPPEELGVSNNMWQVGTLFAKMCLGVFPADPQLAQVFKDDNMRRLAADPAGRERIRVALRERFHLLNCYRYVTFSAENSDIAPLIAGMLKKNPAHRLTPQQALGYVQAIMDMRGLPIPAPLVPRSE